MITNIFIQPPAIKIEYKRANLSRFVYRRGTKKIRARGAFWSGFKKDMLCLPTSPLIEHCLKKSFVAANSGTVWRLSKYKDNPKPEIK